MKTFCIDYRNGGMGNTLLTHILYACQKINIDTNTFFSPEGNAHKIYSISENFELVARHLVEYPDTSVIPLIELTTDEWMRVLRYKMSYAKFHKKYPQEDNYGDFFVIKLNLDQEQDKLWKDFYQSYKDSQWPECDTFAELWQLPKSIQEEILQVYQPPAKTFSTLNLLTISYYDLLNQPCFPNFTNTVQCKLEDYLNANLNPIKQIIEKELHWKWNDQLSTIFHQQVLKNNELYLKWLNNMIHIYNHCINFAVQDVVLQLWERAILLAQVCRHHNIHPNCLDWNNNHCFLEKNNVSLLTNLKEVKHGQTI